MFIGHYGAALAIRKKCPGLPLWTLMLAVQWVDIAFCVFVLAGIEALRIVPGFTEYNPYDLHHMPYTHSLLGSALWAAAAGGAAVAVFSRNAGGRARRAVFAGMSAAVFSHFLLDLVVHTPDLPLTFSSQTKLGLGLWNHLYVALAAELVCFWAGFAWLGWYRNRRYWMFGAALSALTVMTPFQPVPASDTEFAVGALAGYLLLGALAYWVERGQARADQ